MANINLQKMTDTYFDVLKEIGNIGAGNAMTALSQLLSCKIDMKVPQVRLLDFQDVGAMVGGEEQIMLCVRLNVVGDVNGTIMFLIESSSAKHLLGKMMMDIVTPGDEFSEMEFSAMNEVGNIITGAYLNSLASMTNMTIYPSVPELMLDMAGAILSVPAIEFGLQGDKLLLIQSQFFDEIEINGYFILIPDTDSYVKILGALGLPTDDLFSE